MSDLTERLAKAGVPSDGAWDAGCAEISSPDDDYGPRSFRSTIAADAPAILRVLLAARLAEMDEAQFETAVMGARTPDRIARFVALICDDWPEEAPDA